MVATRRASAPAGGVPPAGSHDVPLLTPAALALNIAQLVLAPVPAAVAARSLLVSGMGHAAPLACANALLGASLGLGWVMGTAQGSTWLIDPYWTLIPVLLDAWYRAACPVSRHAPGAPRAAAGSVLLAAWAVRLTHSYFRREGWAVGAREDWRYADMRAVWGKHWWWVSVVPVYAFQHALLAGLTLPLYANRCLEGPVEAAWGGKDWAAVGVALAGLATAAVADNQLYRFVRASATLPPARRAGVLDTGLWALSRHPNYVGETMFWLGVAGLAGAGGVAWPAAGVVLNTACLAAVTRLTEARTAARPGRAAAWTAYVARTPCWVGLPRRA